MGARIRRSRRLLPVAGAMAAVTSIAAGSYWLAQIHDSSSGADEPPLVLADHFPVADRDGGVRYRDVVIPPVEGESVISVGVTRTGMAITYEDNLPNNTVRLFDAGGTRVGEFHDVIGIAIADRTGDLAAFQLDTTPEATADNPAAQTDTSPGIAERVEAVAASAATGQEAGRTASSPDEVVLAAASGKVALGGNDVTRLWEPGQAPARLAYIPDGYMVVAMTPDRIVAASNEERTKVFDLNGSEITESDRLTSLSASASDGHVAGSTAEGDLLTIDLTTGESRLVHPPTEAGLVTYSPDGKFLLTFGELDVFDPHRSVCPVDPALPCTKVTSHDGFYLPNEAILQVFVIGGS
jgi:hypothetical protein